MRTSITVLVIDVYIFVPVLRLSDVRLDVASEDGRGGIALNVEQCQCPVNYIGTSCEQCAPGYYRSKQGPYLGACVPCQCNNRATICDPDSGECQVGETQYLMRAT